jgi:hypothetical protein
LKLNRNGNRRQHQTPLDEPPAEDDGMEIGSTPFVIEEGVVEAVCIRVQKVPYPRFGHQRWKFEFSIANPEHHSGRTIEMFARDHGRQIRIGSKLCDAIHIASGGMKPNQRITTTLFIGKTFRLKTRIAVSKDGKRYTIADSILEKLTG